MSKALKIVAPVLAAVIVTVVFFSLFFVIHEAHHDCTGEGCRICARIEACINTVKSFAKLAAIALVLLLFSGLFIISSHPPKRIFGKENSPVFLKVKLLN